jgi:hypothetical protein
MGNTFLTMPEVHDSLVEWEKIMKKRKTTRTQVRLSKRILISLKLVRMSSWLY